MSPAKCVWNIKVNQKINLLQHGRREGDEWCGQVSIGHGGPYTGDPTDEGAQSSVTVPWGYGSSAEV